MDCSGRSGGCQEVVEQPGPRYHAFMPVPHLVKRYARARLYDTTAACYVTIAELRSWKRSGRAFIVIDAETGDDITRILLA